MTEDATSDFPGPAPAEITERSEDAISRPIDDEIDVFSALANETRYRILLFIAAAEGSVCGCQLESYLDVNQSSISQSLSRLWKAGLLSRTKNGRWRYYDTTPLAEALLAVTTDEHRSAEPVP